MQLNTQNNSHPFFSIDFNDFNDILEIGEYSLIPKGTIAKVHMYIRAGGFQTDCGLPTLNPESGSIYLNCDFSILDGKYANRKIWSLIGLYSAKSDEWTNIGKTFIKNILCSARRIKKNDDSEFAKKGRTIKSLQELQHIEFVARIDVHKDRHNQDQNIIRTAITPEHPEYLKHMGNRTQEYKPSWEN